MQLNLSILVYARSLQAGDDLEKKLSKIIQARRLQKTVSERAFRKTLSQFRPDVIFYNSADPKKDLPLAKSLLSVSGPEIPFIILSEWNDAEAAVELIKSGAADFVPVSNMSRLPEILSRISPDGEKREQEIIPKKSLQDCPTYYREFFQKSNDAIFIHDFEGKIIDVNPRALEMFGYSREEMLNLTVTAFHSGRDRKRSNRAFGKISRDGFVSFEIDFVRKNGSIFSAEVSSSIFEVGNQKLINGIVRDISKRKKAEAVIRESEELFREALNTIPDSIAIHRLKDGAYVYVNSGYTQVTGYRPEEVIGKTTLDIDMWADLEDVNRFREVLLKNGFVRNFRAKFRLKSGEVHTGLVSATIIMFKGQHHFLAITKDIEDLIQAQIEFQQSEEIYHQLIEQSNDGVYILYNDRFEIANRRFIEMFGYTLEELKDPAFEMMQLIAPHSRSFIKERIHKLKAGEDVKPIYEFTALTKDGREIDCEVSISYFPYKDGTATQGILRDIRERKKNEAQLKQLSLAVEQSASSIMIMELDDRISYVNPEFCRISGYTPKEVIGKNANKFGWGNGSLFREIKKKVVAGEEWHGEILNRRKNGEEYWESVSITPIKDAKGNPTRIVKVAEDITEQKKIEREKELYTLLIQNSRDIVAIAGLTGEVLFINRAGREILGLEPEEDVTSMTIRDFHTEESFRKAAEIEMPAVQKSGYYSGESVIKQPKTERTIPVHITSFLVKDIETGEPLAMATIQQDITEQKKVEAELLRLASAVEQSHEAVIITDLNGAIEYVNPAFEQITGYRRAEVLGKNPRILESGKQDPDLYRELWQTITSGKIWKGNLVNRKKDGTFYEVEAAILPIKDRDGNLINFAAVQKDITHQKSLEEQFRQAQKMEAVGQLAGGVAHDFNNLLTVINGYANLLIQQLSAEDPAYKKVQQIQKAGERAARLTSQLLAFSRKQVVQPVILNINEILKDLSKMLRRLLSETIILSIYPDPNLANIEIDAGQLEQIILNLAINARDAMPDGGNLHIETTNRILNQNFVDEHLGSQTGNYVYLAVSDTGIGMSKEVVSHIFEPFYTTKGRGKGTGLGLSTVYGIVKQCGGFIEVNSVPDKGTTFKIYFPATESSKSNDEKTEDTFPVSLKGYETILIVEDEKSVRDLAATILREHGYKIIDAPRASDALEILKEKNPHIDLLLTDIIMPEMNGRDLAKRAGDLYPAIKVVYMSGYTDNSLLSNKENEPEITLIHKPFSPFELVKTIRSVLDPPN